MNKLKEDILNDAKKGSRDTTNASNETTGATNNVSNETTNASNETTSATNTATNPAASTNNTATTRSNDTYVYSVSMLAVLAIGVCVFFAYNTFPKNKNLVNEKQDQPPKRRHML